MNVNDDQSSPTPVTVLRAAAAQGKATVAVTERALNALVALRTAQQPSPRQALGLVMGLGGAVVLILDLPTDRDCLFSRNEAPIFFVASEVVARFRGRILDRVMTGGKVTFVLRDGAS